MSRLKKYQLPLMLFTCIIYVGGSITLYIIALFDNLQPAFFLAPLFFGIYGLYHLKEYHEELYKFVNNGVNEK